MHMLVSSLPLTDSLTSLIKGKQFACFCTLRLILYVVIFYILQSMGDSKMRRSTRWTSCFVSKGHGSFLFLICRREKHIVNTNHYWFYTDNLKKKIFILKIWRWFIHKKLVKLYHDIWDVISAVLRYSETLLILYKLSKQKKNWHGYFIIQIWGDMGNQTGRE